MLENRPSPSRSRPSPTCRLSARPRPGTGSTRATPPRSRSGRAASIARGILRARHGRSGRVSTGCPTVCCEPAAASCSPRIRKLGAGRADLAKSPPGRWRLCREASKPGAPLGIRSRPLRRSSGTLSGSTPCLEPRPPRRRPGRDASLCAMGDRTARRGRARRPLGVPPRPRIGETGAARSLSPCRRKQRGRFPREPEADLGTITEALAAVADRRRRVSVCDIR